MALPFLGALINGFGKIVDDVHTSDEERLKAKQGLLSLQIEANSKVLEYEAGIVKAQADIIKTEAASGNFLAANWRPITMLTLVALVSAHWLGFTPENLTEAEVLALLEIVKWGLGGYVVGRTAEKVIPSTMAAYKQKEKV